MIIHPTQAYFHFKYQILERSSYAKPRRALTFDKTSFLKILCASLFELLPVRAGHYLRLGKQFVMMNMLFTQSIYFERGGKEFKLDR
jgi:hypothetical protein